jgi:uncharacterized protein
MKVAMAATMGPLVAVVGAALWSSLRLTRRPTPDPARSPAELGLPYEEVAFLAADGITLRGWLMPAPRPRGTLILLHGWSGSMDADLDYVPALHEHGYTVLTFDFRAHGRSGGDVVSLGFYERRDVEAAVDFLRRRGLERVGLFGLSMGASTAIVAAPAIPSVRAVVADGAFARPMQAVAGSLAARGVPTPLAALVAQLAIWFAGARLGCHLDDAAPLHWVALLAPRGLFLISGEDDPHVPPADVRALYARAGMPKELWIQAGAGHREVASLAGHRYLERILAFFDRSFPSHLGEAIQEG